MERMCNQSNPMLQSFVAACIDSESGQSIVAMLLSIVIFSSGAVVFQNIFKNFVETREAIRHATAFEETIGLLTKLAVQENNRQNQMPCQNLSLMGTAEGPLLRPSPSPTPVYPVILAGMQQLKYSGKPLLSVGKSAGNADSIELIQVMPRLSNRPALIYAILKIVSAKLNPNTPARTYEIPFTFRVDTTTSKIIGCETPVLIPSNQVMCDAYGKVWNNGSWSCI